LQLTSKEAEVINYSFFVQAYCQTYQHMHAFILMVAASYTVQHNMALN